MDDDGSRRTRAAGLARQLRSALVRPLVEDDERVAYWRRHVQIGVLLSVTAALAVLAYSVVCTTGAHGSRVVHVLVVVVLLGTPALLLLPLPAMLRDSRGALLFYAWSTADTAVIAVIARIDGGASSPLSTLLFLALAFMAVAYPPLGVLAMGSCMTAVHLLVIAAPHVDLLAAFVAFVMASFTVTLALSSSNQWQAYDTQLRLIREQRVLATTDPLTGCLNRRAFLDRLATAAADAHGGEATVVCLLDLDGFKAVNDAAGHAAGDRVLQQVARVLTATLREPDVVARLGGDEFAVLAAAPSPEGAEAVAHRVRQAVSDACGDRGVRASVGVTAVLPGDDVHELLSRADAAMYRAKAAGGDRVAACAG